jgi:ABC-type antimicrobial peptide transport system permease subunit
LLPSDDRLDAPLAMVISHGYWRSQFAADTSVLGRTVRLRGLPVVIVALFGLSPTDAPTIVAAVMVLAGVTAASALVPARRAMRLDPAVALRRE